MSFKRPWRSTPVVLGEYSLAKERQKQRRRQRQSAILFVTTLVAVFGIGMLATNWRLVKSHAPFVGRLTGSNFGVCTGTVRWNCVVDGDTFWRTGVKVRIADIDTPEIFSPHCPAEYERGLQATARLQQLLNAGPFDLAAVPDRDVDRFGRKLRVVIRDGRSLGDQLVREGLARTWAGRREPWC